MKTHSAKLWGTAVCTLSLIGQPPLSAQLSVIRSASEIKKDISVPPILLASENHTSTSIPTITSTSAATIPAPPAPNGTALTLATAVRVTAKPTKPLEPLPTSTYEFTGKELLQSAGTFSDLPRYLQTLPGLIGGSDAQDASFVRGGNSFEDAFTIDKIEVQNLNHLALANSTGGLGSMLDSEFISGVSFSSGDKNAANSGAMSSLTEIHTYELPQKPTYSVDMGYTGGGFRISRPIGLDKSFLFSARESVTNLFINDIGLNGSPEFTNSFMKYTFNPSSRDHLWIDSLSGRDNLQVRPAWNDTWETNAYNTDYSGWRNTTGMVWQHTLQSDAVTTLVLSNSQSSQNLDQRDQLNNDQTVFLQDNREGITDLKYSYLTADDKGSSREMGLDIHLNRINNDVAQPAGIYSPYSDSTTPMEAFSANPSFSTLDKAAFYDFTQAYGKRAILKAGIRYEMFGYNYTKIIKTQSSTTASSSVKPAAEAQAEATDAATCCCGSAIPSNNAFMPHVSFSFLATSKLNFRASWNRSAELPPYATLASQESNAYLGLIHDQQMVVGTTARLNNYLTADVEAYRKTYTGYPVSTAYPQMSLASILPTINEPFSLFSMSSNGKGVAQGVEFSFKQSPWHHFFTAANLSFARAQFTGLDGIYRSGAADLPVVLNVTGGIKIKSFLITARETATSGRPYTPLLTAESKKQNRAIYDLTQINALRGNTYSRTDIAVNREILVHGKVLRLHGGILNVFDRQNFYEKLWRPRSKELADEPSMGLQPDFGMSYTF